MKAVWYSGSMFISIAFTIMIYPSTCYLANLASGQSTILLQCWFKSHDACMQGLHGNKPHANLICMCKPTFFQRIHPAFSQAGDSEHAKDTSATVSLWP